MPEIPYCAICGDDLDFEQDQVRFNDEYEYFYHYECGLGDDNPFSDIAWDDGEIPDVYGAEDD